MPKCIIFTFGTVDINHSFYYDAIIKNQIHDQKYYSKLAYDYISFISKLDMPIKIVICVYPHPVKEDLIFTSLCSYGVLNSTDILPKELTEYNNKRTIFFNSQLKLYCDQISVSPIWRLLFF